MFMPTRINILAGGNSAKRVVKEPTPIMKIKLNWLENGARIKWSKGNGFSLTEPSTKAALPITSLTETESGCLSMVIK